MLLIYQFNGDREVIEEKKFKYSQKVYIYNFLACLSVCLSVTFYVHKLKSIVILEAYDEKITIPKNFRPQLQSCGFSRVPKVGKSMQKLEFFFLFLYFLGKSMIMSLKKWFPSSPTFGRPPTVGQSTKNLNFFNHFFLQIRGF
jgi:hypothetical protein